LVKIKYAANSTLVRQKKPIVAPPGKPVARAIQVGFYVTNKEIMDADDESRVMVKRVTHKKKKLNRHSPSRTPSRSF
jgi:hypothetical protein